MCVKCLTQYLAHRKLYSVTISVVILVTSGPLEERGSYGRWASGYTGGTAFHFTGRGKQDEEIWTKAWDGILLVRDREGTAQQIGKNVFT